MALRQPALTVAAGLPSALYCLLLLGRFYSCAPKNPSCSWPLTGRWNSKMLQDAGREIRSFFPPQAEQPRGRTTSMHGSCSMYCLTSAIHNSNCEKEDTTVYRNIKELFIGVLNLDEEFNHASNTAPL